MNLLTILEQKPVIFVGGKGGVGKTTTAAALAVRFAAKGQKTLIISTDPAHSLGDAFAVPLTNKPKPLAENLTALELNPQEIIHQHFKQIERTLEGYTSPEMMPKMREFLRLSHHAPGAEEAAMLEAICQHLLTAQEEGYQHIIFDTAPTGHTLRLLNLPEMMQAWTDGLLTQQHRQSRLRGAAAALGREGNPFEKEDRWHSAVTVLEKRRALFQKAREVLHNPAQTGILLVLIAESLPFSETKRAVQQLNTANLPCAGVIINQVISLEQQEIFWQLRAKRQRDILKQIQGDFSHLPQLEIPLHAADIRGIQALAEIFNSIEDKPISLGLSNSEL